MHILEPRIPAANSLFLLFANYDYIDVPILRIFSCVTYSISVVFEN